MIVVVLAVLDVQSVLLFSLLVMAVAQATPATKSQHSLRRRLAKRPTTRVVVGGVVSVDCCCCFASWLFWPVGLSRWWWWARDLDVYTEGSKP